MSKICSKRHQSKFFIFAVGFFFISRIYEIISNLFIQYYLENKVAPPVHHYVQPFDRLFMSRLCDVTPSLLPDRWRELMLIHQGIRHRSMSTPFALRPSVSQANLSHDVLPGIIPLPNWSAPTSTPIAKKRNPRAKSKKTNSDIHLANNKIMPTSQADTQIVYLVVHDDLIQSDNLSQMIEVC